MDNSRVYMSVVLQRRSPEQRRKVFGLKWRFGASEMDRAGKFFLVERVCMLKTSIISGVVVGGRMSRLCTTASGYAREGGIKMCSRCAEELTRPVRTVEGRILSARYAIEPIR
jgi:hypothetical protein